MNTSTFTELNLKPALLSNLASLGYTQMTDIQAASLPKILAGRDVLGRAKTGSGKTAAFALGLLEKLAVESFKVQALVLCPTRELADQVAVEIRRLGRGVANIKVLTLYGGVPLGPQIASLEYGAHVVVGTPGRIADHLNKSRLHLNGVTTLVLDEADRMLDMGFKETIDAIIHQVPSQRQTLLFSATYPAGIRFIASRVMQNPEIVEVESTHDGNVIKQVFFPLEAGISREEALHLLLKEYQPDNALVFCNTRLEVQEVCTMLRSNGFDSLGIQGDMEQWDRDRTLVQFANKSISILVATDVAARGLDIQALDLVINYQLARDSEVHIHRIGRTGRAGSHGLACSLFGADEEFRITRIEDILKQPLTRKPLPKKSVLNNLVKSATMVTLQIGSGKKQKIRPTDILGALTGPNGISGDQVGKINIFDQRAYVAVNRPIANKALKKLVNGKIKGRSVRAWLIDG